MPRFINIIQEPDISPVSHILTGSVPELHVEPLIPLSITLLCSPRLLKGARALRSPEDVMPHTLLHDNRAPRYGHRSFRQQWLDAAGDAGPRFTHSLLALEAAIEGLGAVESTPVLASDALRSGALVAPFDLEVPLGCDYDL
jgi:LysR family glycine cleavage system transcriptional activator